jgi:hypothetical protein
MTMDKEARQRKHALASLRLHALGLHLKVTKDAAPEIYYQAHSVMTGTAKTGGPMKGAKATVESEGEIRSRFTATRFLALWPFALAFKKKTSDKDVYVIIEHTDYLITDRVPTKKEQDAYRFAREFNAVAAGL